VRSRSVDVTSVVYSNHTFWRIRCHWTSPTHAPPKCGSCGGYGPLLKRPDQNPELFPCALEGLPHRVDQQQERPPSGDASLAAGSNVVLPSPSERAASGTFTLLALPIESFHKSLVWIHLTDTGNPVVTLHGSKLHNSHCLCMPPAAEGHLPRGPHIPHPAHPTVVKQGTKCNQTPLDNSFGLRGQRLTSRGS